MSFESNIMGELHSSNEYRKVKLSKRAHPYKGHCYVASEALYHLMGGKKSGWKPMYMKHEGESHWFLQHEDGEILDPTAEQFRRKPDYSKARGKGFLTKQPSKRTKKLLKAIQPKEGQWWHADRMMDSGCGGGVQVAKTDRWYVYTSYTVWGGLFGPNSVTKHGRIRKKRFMELNTYIHD